MVDRTLVFACTKESAKMFLFVCSFCCVCHAQVEDTGEAVSPWWLAYIPE